VSGKDPVEDAEARIRENLDRLGRLMREAAARSGRDAGAVGLLAVTKYAEPEWVRALHRAGVRDFGESTVQRGAAARESFADLDGARWHLIGHLQRNKAARALSTFDSIHSIDSVRLVRELAEQARRRSLPVPHLYVEVNIAGDPGKTGLPPGEIGAVLEAARAEEVLAGAARKGGVAGLMAMAPPPAPGEPPGAAESARPHFRKLRDLRDEMVRRGLLPAGAGLSMGMSSDFLVAIEEGATIVRVGSALFEGLTRASL
jgi:pyridoxal phosphate enzyme (YggS family)